MIYRHFRVGIIIRVLMLAILAIAFAFVITSRQMLFVPVALAALFIGVVFSLIRYIEKSNQDMTHFLLSIRQGAFTEGYSSGSRGKKFEELSEAFNDVIQEFAKLNLEKELHYQYLKTLNENINVGILSFDSEGKLLTINQAGKQLLKVNSLFRLEDLKRVDPVLFEKISRMNPEEKQVIRISGNSEPLQLGVYTKEIVLQGSLVKIILIQNLNHELEAKEIEAWYQLIRVLTHEIMNSVTPIISLTGAIQRIMKNSDGSAKAISSLTEDNTADIHESIDTIETRSKNLIRFVNAYKEYAKPIEIHPSRTDLIQLTRQALNLFKPDLEQRQITITTNFPNENLIINVDVALIEQVLINLLKNAMEAVNSDGTGAIGVAIKEMNRTVHVVITDNGEGIDPELINKIFIPFFTTKPKGTGVGLSLSRQIMKLHRGNLIVTSVQGKGSAFTLQFPIES